MDARTFEEVRASVPQRPGGTPPVGRLESESAERYPERVEE